MLSDLLIVLISSILAQNASKHLERVIVVFIANGCQPFKSKLRSRALLYKNKIWYDLDCWHTKSLLYPQQFL